MSVEIIHGKQPVQFTIDIIFFGRNNSIRIIVHAWTMLLAILVRFCCFECAIPEVIVPLAFTFSFIVVVAFALEVSAGIIIFPWSEIGLAIIFPFAFS